MCVCVCVATEAWVGSMGRAMNKQWSDVSEANTGATPVSTVSNNTSSYSPYIETCMDYKHVVTIFFISHMNAWPLTMHNTVHTVLSSIC